MPLGTENFLFLLGNGGQGPVLGLDIDPVPGGGGGGRGGCSKKGSTPSLPVASGVTFFRSEPTVTVPLDREGHPSGSQCIDGETRGQNPPPPKFIQPDRVTRTRTKGSWPSASVAACCGLIAQSPRLPARLLLLTPNRLGNRWRIQSALGNGGRGQCQAQRRHHPLRAPDPGLQEQEGCFTGQMLGSRPHPQLPGHLRALSMASPSSRLRPGGGKSCPPLLWLRQALPLSLSSGMRVKHHIHETPNSRGIL